MGTNKALYVHRKGSNVIYGSYYVDYDSKNLLSHYGGKRFVPLDQLKAEYTRLKDLIPEQVSKDSPLNPGAFTAEGTPQSYYDLNRNAFTGSVSEKTVSEVLKSIDSQGRWLIKHVPTSHPYVGDGQKQEPTDQYASTNVGDETDTSPYRDPSEQDYISTGEYIKNMNLLIGYIRTIKTSDNLAKPVRK
jgi:hypothetical protein